MRVLHGSISRSYEGAGRTKHLAASHTFPEPHMDMDMEHGAWSMEHGHGTWTNHGRGWH